MFFLLLGITVCDYALPFITNMWRFLPLKDPKANLAQKAICHPADGFWSVPATPLGFLFQ